MGMAANDMVQKAVDSIVNADPSLAKELLGWVATRKDVRDMVGPAWLWMSGPRGGRYPENKLSK
jgi:UDP-glucose 4-epimerase